MGPQRINVTRWCSNYLVFIILNSILYSLLLQMKKRILLVVFTTLILSATHAQSVISDYDTRTDFKKFKTYAWLAPGDSVLNRYRADKPFGGYVMLYADQELVSRGLKPDTLGPDAIIVFYTSVEEITTYSQSATLSVGVGVAGPGYYVAGSTPVAGGKITASTVEDGSLKFAMYDTETKKQVWTGMVSKQFKLSDDVIQLIHDYTAKIFKKYPVKKK
jgi:Domain of unknown function (DUF4136)